MESDKKLLQLEYRCTAPVAELHIIEGCRNLIVGSTVHAVIDTLDGDEIIEGVIDMLSDIGCVIGGKEVLYEQIISLEEMEMDTSGISISNKPVGASISQYRNKDCIEINKTEFKKFIKNNEMPKSVTDYMALNGKTNDFYLKNNESGIVLNMNKYLKNKQ